MSKKRAAQAERTLISNLEAGETYRASMRAELQKFGREDEPTQLRHCRHGKQQSNLKGEDIAAENRELDRKHKAEVERCECGDRVFES